MAQYGVRLIIGKGGMREARSPRSATSAAPTSRSSAARRRSRRRGSSRSRTSISTTSTPSRCGSSASATSGRCWSRWTATDGSALRRRASTTRRRARAQVLAMLGVDATVTLKRVRTDILILGSGGAGLFAALHAHQADPDAVDHGRRQGPARQVRLHAHGAGRLQRRARRGRFDRAPFHGHDRGRQVARRTRISRGRW